VTVTEKSSDLDSENSDAELNHDEKMKQHENHATGYHQIPGEIYF
jgi:hypothetical protein